MTLFDAFSGHDFKRRQFFLAPEFCLIGWHAVEVDPKVSETVRSMTLPLKDTGLSYYFVSEGGPQGLLVANFDVRRRKWRWKRRRLRIRRRRRRRRRRAVYVVHSKHTDHRGYVLHST